MRIFLIGLLLCYSGITLAGRYSQFFPKREPIDPGRYSQFFPNREPIELEPIPEKQTQMPWETNYWECILDEMPGAKTKTVTFAVRKKCNQYGKNYKIEKKSSFFGIKNASECVIKYASDTPSETAAKAIRAACNKLYVR